MNRRTRTLSTAVGLCAGAALVAGIAVAAVTTTPAGASPSGSSGSASSGATGSTGTVTEQTLTESKTFAGTLGHGEAVPLLASGSGTVTWLPEFGDTIGRDGVLYAVDERPVRSMHGAVPLYRTLVQGNRGQDVRQLNDNLAALGYTVAVDDSFGADTRSAVVRWQRDRGLPATGTLDASQVAFVDGDVRVAERTGRVGSPATEVLRYTSTVRAVTASVPAADATRFARGATVRVGFGSGEPTTGTVRSLGVTAGGGTGDGAGSGGAGAGEGSDEVAVVIDLDGPVPGDVAESSGVDVTVSGRSVEDALSVPVNALLAGRSDEGDYVLEVRRGGATVRVPVTIGFVANGRVAVEGRVRAGDKVVVP